MKRIRFLSIVAALFVIWVGLFAVAVERNGPTHTLPISVSV